MKMHFTSLIRKSQQFEHISHRSGHINSHPALSFPSFLFHCLYPKLPFFTRESHSLNNYLRTSLCLRVCSQRSPDLENPLKRKSFPVFLLPSHFLPSPLFSSFLLSCVWKCIVFPCECVLVGRGAEAGGIYRVNTAVTFFYCQQQRYVHSFSFSFLCTL